MPLCRRRTLRILSPDLEQIAASDSAHWLSAWDSLKWNLQQMGCACGRVFAVPGTHRLHKIQCPWPWLFGPTLSVAVPSMMLWTAFLLQAWRFHDSFQSAVVMRQPE